MNIMQNLFDMQKIYHRSIFDCFNQLVSAKWTADQCIDSRQVVAYQRQYHSRAVVMPSQLEAIFSACKDIVVEFSTMMCGVIRDKEHSLTGTLKLMSQDKIDAI